MALDTATLAIRLTLNGAQAAQAGLRGVADAGSMMGRTLGAINQHAFFLMGNLDRLVGMANRVREGLTNAFITPNADKEQATKQFENLLGNLELAKRRMEELDEVKMTTPFSEEAVIASSLTLQKFGDGALAAGSGLRVVADVAAWANEPIEQVAQAFGLAYQSIQTGGDLGNAARQLVSMGVISRATADRLAEMSDAGKNAETTKKSIADLTLELQRYDAEQAVQRSKKQRGAGDDPLAYFNEREIEAKRARLAELQADLERLNGLVRDPAALWAEFTSEIGKTNGAAARMNDTFKASVAAIRKDWDEFKEQMGEGLFDAVRTDVMALRDQIQAAFDDGTVERWAKTAGMELANLYAEAKKQSILGIAFEDLRVAADSGTLFQTVYAGLSMSFKNAVLTLVDLVRLHGPDIVAALTPSWLPDFGISKGKQQVAALARGEQLTEPLTPHGARMLQDEWAKRNPDDPMAKWTRRGIATSDFMSGEAFWKNLGPDVAGLARGALEVKPAGKYDVLAELQRRELGRWSPAPSDRPMEWPMQGTYSPGTGMDILSAIGFNVAAMPPSAMGSADAIAELLARETPSSIRDRIGAGGEDAVAERMRRLVGILDQQVGLNKEIEQNLRRIVETTRDGAAY